MRFIGHTMGTPGRTVYESIDVFHGIGLDGMELVCRNGTDFYSQIDDASASRMADYGAYNNLPVVTLTPYVWDINSPDETARRQALEELRRTIDLADLMRARFVRAYGGRECMEHPVQAFERTVAALRQAGDYAGEKHITVIVENHMGSMTRTGEATRRLLDEVALPNVRALYDPANVLFDTDETWQTTLEVQTAVIAYVHVKDFELQGADRRARIVGDGVVPWRDILAGLVACGYDGCLSFEYEKMWHPDQLPAAEVGLARCLHTVRKMLNEAASGQAAG